jgi:hypothetical protein
MFKPSFNKVAKKTDFRPSSQETNLAPNTRAQDVASFDAMVAARPLEPPKRRINSSQKVETR